MKNREIKIEDSVTGRLNASISVNVEENKSEILVEPVQNENDIMFIAFGRIYSGTIRRGQDVFVLGPKHDPSKITDKVSFVGCYVSLLVVVIQCYI